MSANHLVALLLLHTTVVLIPVVVFAENRIILEETIHRHGYPAEVHKVTTSDGYILRVARMPNPGKPPALLVHGIFFSSAEWTVLGKSSLPMRLFDAGFDVWLMNCRGNSFSRRHTKLSPKAEPFWNFSWHEIGLLDLPVVIDYVLQISGFQKLHYVAHSQGTTVFFVLNSMLPEYGRKIETTHLLAPTIFMRHIRCPPCRALHQRITETRAIVQMMGWWELFGREGALTDVLSPEAFQMIMYYLVGMRSMQLNQTIIRRIMETIPAGASYKQFDHFGQLVGGERFHQFDYGPVLNRVRYNATIPPEYRVEAARGPVAVYYSDNDWLAAQQDVKTLVKKLPNVILAHHVLDPEFNHVDFLFDAGSAKVYDEIVRIMTTYGKADE